MVWGTSRVTKRLTFCNSCTKRDTATKTCDVSSAPAEIQSTGGPTATVSKTVSSTLTVTVTSDLTPAPSTFRESVTIWTTISPGSGEAGPMTELLTTTEFATVHSTIISTKVDKSVETTTSVSTTTVTESSQSG